MIKATLNKIKIAIRDYLFKDHKDFLDDVYELKTKVLEDNYQKKIQNLDVADLVREKLNGLRLTHLSNDVSDIMDTLIADDNVDTNKVGMTENQFLQYVKAIHDNPAFEMLLNWLTREQVLKGLIEVNTVAELNFGRASINGWVLLREEVDTLTKRYLERNKPGENFDKNEPI